MIGDQEENGKTEDENKRIADGEGEGTSDESGE